MAELLLLFTNEDKIDTSLNYISKNYAILYNKIFVFQHDEFGKEDNHFITFNIDIHNSNTELYNKNIIRVHRKKQTNSIYTINAMNELIKTLNNGELDKNFQINWNKYFNSLILYKNNELKIISLKLKKVFEI